MERPAFPTLKRTVVSLSVVASFAVGTLAATSSSADFFALDPGVRGGAPGAGGPIAGLTANQFAFFDQGLDDFNDQEVLADGLGPRFNLDSCGGCHAQPASGGSSPAVNPEVAV